MTTDDHDAVLSRVRAEVAEARNAPESTLPLPPSDDTGRDSPAAHGQARPQPGPDLREPFGRAAFGAHVSALAEQEEPPWQDRPPTWEELSDGDREFYMRIGHDVADYALTENAVTWGTSCTSCARVLDSAYAETVRREAAEGTLAEVRRVVAGFLAHYGHTTSASFKVAGDLAHGVMQVIDRGKSGSEEGR